MPNFYYFFYLCLSGSSYTVVKIMRKMTKLDKVINSYVGHAKRNYIQKFGTKETLEFMTCLKA